MNVAFWDNYLCERGTTTSLFDYAHHNQTLLGNKSFIFYNSSLQSVPAVVDKFKKHFLVIGVKSFQDVDSHLKELNITHIYIIKSGEANDQLSKVAKNCIHCVFTASTPHGDVYAAISPHVRGVTTHPVVPHMINLPSHDENLRKSLNIPEDALIFGGYGGKNQFDIPYVRLAVAEFAINNPSVHFLFANFNPIAPKCSNVHNLPMILDLSDKVKFINTCDAMLHARSDGETFGIAIGEFSTKNKRIITCASGDRAHLAILKDKALVYSDKASLTKILTEFKTHEGDWNAYKDYTPAQVMKVFQEVFL